MTFETKNSVYSVTVEHGMFAVRKIAEINESNFNALGMPRYSSYMKIEVGKMADFGDWHTSVVTRLL